MKNILILITCLITILCIVMLKRPQVSADLKNEVENRSLVISGQIPEWLSGTLIRNGPVNVMVNGKKNEHWFDGLAMLHAFSFHDSKITYSNKFLRTDAYRTVFEKGSINYVGFASDPCRSLFKRFLTFFISNPQSELHNANVNVAKLANQYVALTETPLPVKFDPQTLETLGVLDYQDELPKEKCWESAHPHQSLNYLIKFGRNSFYTLYQVNETSIERKIIAEVPVEQPAYMHSFALTENYIILTEFPLVVKPLDLITKNQAFIKNFTWQPQRGTQFIVVDRKNGSVVGKYLTKPFFAFHHANAFEKEGSIYFDIVTYQDASIITESNEAAPTQLERFSLSLKTGEIASQVIFSESNEFPRLNEAYDGKPYQFVYLAALGSGKLYKVNTDTHEVMSWFEEGCSVGEPVFIANPEANQEDDGVVAAVVLDRAHQDSFLLILDGKSFKEMGRARAPHQIPEGLHGQYFNPPSVGAIR